MEVLVNNQKWKIEETNEQDFNLIVEGKIRQGTTHYDKQTIYLLENLLPDRKEEVLLHELAHAFLYATQISYVQEQFDEENVCEFVSLYSKKINSIANDYFKKEE